ncbi:hypothetical protein [Kitasatospora sp. NPDC094011]|uniref:hypothetical protein n=1 Tax=Kitasatospora sp. NPDC094011 TaxID=3364090 RepID=UPI0038301D4B
MTNTVVRNGGSSPHQPHQSWSSQGPRWGPNLLRPILPIGHDRAERLRAVPHVLYVIFNEGYTAGPGDQRRRDGVVLHVAVAHLQMYR